MCGLNILAGNSGAGKSTFGLQMILNTLIAGNPACIMCSDQKLSGQGQFMWSNHTGTQIKDLQEFSDERFAMSEWPLQFYEGQFELSAILSSIRLKAARGVRWFLIDYLGLIQYSDAPNQHERKEHITECLKRLSHELQLYTMLISRGTKVGQNERPSLRHVEGGAGVSNAADQVWWFEADHANPPDVHRVEFLNLKSRQSGISQLVIKLEGKIHRFSNWPIFPV